MGAWGSGSFDNDDAADLLDGLASGDSRSLVFATLDEIASAGADEYLEAPEASAALAAAEVVAAWRGRPCDDPPAALTALPTCEVDAVLLDLANRAVARIFESSELRDLWEESDSFAEWEDAVGDLLDRLEPTGGRKVV